MNQDSAAQPMRPVYRTQGLEVWRKPLAAPANSFALVLFHRNYSSTAVPASAPAASDALTSGDCQQAAAFDLAVGSMPPAPIRLRANTSLCVGVIGTCTCSNPPSPRLGLVQCSAAKAWSCPDCAGVSGGVIIPASSSTPLDFNVGPKCSGDLGDEVLLYPRQNRGNEIFTYDKSSGEIKLGGHCLGAVSSAPHPGPPPPPPPPVPRQIGVSWAQLGLDPNEQVTVRDLWQHKTLGTFQGQFNATIAFHEAALFVVTRGTGRHNEA